MFERASIGPFNKEKALSRGLSRALWNPVDSFSLTRYPGWCDPSFWPSPHQVTRHILTNGSPGWFSCGYFLANHSAAPKILGILGSPLASTSSSSSAPRGVCGAGARFRDCGNIGTHLYRYRWRLETRTQQTLCPPISFTKSSAFAIPPLRVASPGPAQLKSEVF